MTEDMRNDVDQQSNPEAPLTGNGEVSTGTPDGQSDNLVQAALARISIEERQFSASAYDRRKTMLGIAVVVFAFTAGGFKLSKLNFAGFALESRDELSLLLFMMLLLTYTIGDFWLFVRPEIASWRAELESFESKFGDGARVIEDMWKQVLVHASQTQGINSALTHEAKRRAAVSARSHAEIIRMHRVRVFWESAVPIGIACVTLMLGFKRILTII